eukprot:gene7186-9701_t
MADPLILALDQGTTSTRAILFDVQGRALADASRPLQQSYPNDGWVEHDADEIWTASVEVLREAVEKAGRPLADIAAIGVTNQRETVADRDGVEVRRVVAADRLEIAADGQERFAARAAHNHGVAAPAVVGAVAVGAEGAAEVGR